MSDKRHPSQGGGLTRKGDVELDLWLYARHVEGLSLDAIKTLCAMPRDDGGQELVLSVTTVWRRIKERRAERLAMLGENIDADRLTKLEKIDQAERGYRRLAVPSYLNAYGEVVERDERVVLAALDGILKCVREAAKLLGLDAPVKSAVELVVHDGVTTELNAMLAELGLPTIDAEP